jgi:2-polyprenyl-6-methoxyphenol hydroxylase-like FAD-dependent oxidoreductase
MKYFDHSENVLMEVDFDGLIGKTRFPFYILCPQHITEGVLSEKLKDIGIPVIRPYKAVGMRQNDKDSRAVDVSFENGQSITAQYVIGADGAQSTVRASIHHVLVRRLLWPIDSSNIGPKLCGSSCHS